jgi:hypothetical protein
MPGSAIGNTNSNEIVSLPKNLYLEMAAAASDPRTNAMAVANKATVADLVIASLTPSLTAALPHQEVVKPVGGQANEVLVLKELITTNTSGT